MSKEKSKATFADVITAGPLLGFGSNGLTTEVWLSWESGGEDEDDGCLPKML